MSSLKTACLSFIFLAFCVVSLAAQVPRKPTAKPKPSAARTAHSDLKYEGLKGRVKSISVEKQEAGDAVPRLKQSERYYDGAGLLLRVVWFDDKGKAAMGIGFNNVKGKRMSGREKWHPQGKITGEIKYDSVYFYKYDGQGRVIEETIRAPSGNLSSRRVTAYKKETISRAAFDPANKETLRMEESPDADGNVIKRLYIYPPLSPTETESHIDTVTLNTIPSIKKATGQNAKSARTNSHTPNTARSNITNNMERVPVSSACVKRVRLISHENTRSITVAFLPLELKTYLVNFRYKLPLALAGGF